jgi:hypothetical protein
VPNRVISYDFEVLRHDPAPSNVVPVPYSSANLLPICVSGSVACSEFGSAGGGLRSPPRPRRLFRRAGGPCISRGACSQMSGCSWIHVRCFRFKHWTKAALATDDPCSTRARSPAGAPRLRRQQWDASQRRTHSGRRCTCSRRYGPS